MTTPVKYLIIDEGLCLLITNEIFLSLYNHHCLVKVVLEKETFLN
jgi:hypothetical protein